MNFVLSGDGWLWKRLFCRVKVLIINKENDKIQEMKHFKIEGSNP